MHYQQVSDACRRRSIAVLRLIHSKAVTCLLMRLLVWGGEQLWYNKMPTGLSKQLLGLYRLIAGFSQWLAETTQCA
jgi:hypothetical protein